MKKIILKAPSDTITVGQLDARRGIVAYQTKSGTVAFLMAAPYAGRYKSSYGFRYYNVESNGAFESDTIEGSIEKAIMSGRNVLYFENQKQFFLWAAGLPQQAPICDNDEL